MIYTCSKGFYLAKEITKDNRFVDSMFHVVKCTTWTWLNEEGEIIICKNKDNVEIYLDRYYFVQHFTVTDKGEKDNDGNDNKKSSADA